MLAVSSDSVLQKASSIIVGQALTRGVFRVLPRVMCTLNSCQKRKKKKSISKLDIKQSFHLIFSALSFDLFCQLGKNKHLQSNVSCKQVACDLCLCKNSNTIISGRKGSSNHPFAHNKTGESVYSGMHVWWCIA